MKLGITGAAGFLGLRILQLAEGKHEIVAIDNGLLARGWEAGGTTIQKMDIRDRNAMEKAFSGVDAIIHLAAISGLDACGNNPEGTFDVNIGAVAGISWICKKHKTPLVFASSMAVFGDPKEYPITENLPRNPKTLYGYSKYVGEGIIKTMSRGSFPATVFLKSNVYGRYFVGDSEIMKGTVVNRFIRNAREGKPLVVYRPGTQARNFIHVDDAARAYLIAAEMTGGRGDGTEVYNLANKNGISIANVAKMVLDMAKEEGATETEINFVENPRKNEALSDRFDVDISKVSSEFGFEPQISLREGIRASF